MSPCPPPYHRLPDDHDARNEDFRNRVLNPALRRCDTRNDLRDAGWRERVVQGESMWLDDVTGRWFPEDEAARIQRVRKGGANDGE